jgi:hypothetical protein
MKEIRCEGFDWIHLAQDRNMFGAVVNTVTNFQLPKGRGISRLAKCLSACKNCSPSCHYYLFVWGHKKYAIKADVIPICRH